MYWAQAVAAQTDDTELAAQFSTFASAMSEQEDVIVAELAATQGKPAGLDGYYHARRETVKEVMRPSATLNAILASASN